VPVHFTVGVNLRLMSVTRESICKYIDQLKLVCFRQSQTELRQSIDTLAEGMY